MGLTEANLLLNTYNFRQVFNGQDPLVDSYSFLYRHQFFSYYARVTVSLKTVKVEIFHGAAPSHTKIYKKAEHLCQRIENLFEFSKIR
jgi:hypothetical protein